MATKGYNSYRGRTSAGKVILIVVLVLVLLGAVAYLLLENYLVYDESGNARLELPFLQRQEQQQQQPQPPQEKKDPPIDSDEIIVDIIEPEDPYPEIPSLHATRLPDDCLWWEPEYILTQLAPEDLVLAVKRTTGGITYGTSVETPAGVTVETGRPIDCLKELLAGDRYVVGELVCFRDSGYSRARQETALLRQDGRLWYDAGGQAWLDPTNPEVLQYITALVKECADLGFDEILLDQFCYPADAGDVANTAGDAAQVLADFARSLRAALPETVRLSVVVRDGDGLTVTELAELFDRLYVPQTGDLAAVQDALPYGYAPDSRVVAMTSAAAASGSYMVVR